MNKQIQIALNRYGKDLPENLESKAVVVSHTGAVGKVIRCSAHNELGERLYRLRYTYKFSNGLTSEITSDQPYIETDRRGNPVVIGHGWTRDQMVNMGCLYIRRADVAVSHIIEAIPIFGS